MTVLGLHHGRNYLKVLTDPYYVTVFVNTLSVAAITTIVSLIVAFPFAQFVVRASGPTRNLLLWCVYVPLYVSVISAPSAGRSFWPTAA